jgi:hypothetical protein
MKLYATICVLAGSLLWSAHCSACDVARMEADMLWCIQDNCKNAGGRTQCDQLHGGACIKDSSKLDSGFEGCQKDNRIQDNYHSCSPGQRIDSMRAVLARNGEACR